VKAGSRAPLGTEPGRGPSGTPERGEPPRRRKTRRRKLRKKVTRDKDHEWELARQDAWLREMLTDSSGSESQEKYARFAESGKMDSRDDWNPAAGNDDLKRGVFRTREAGFLKSS
jgi:hypothetical protein